MSKTPPFVVPIVIFAAMSYPHALCAHVKDDLRLKTLPRQLKDSGQPSALDYHHVPVNLATAISKEPLVDLSEFRVAGENYYAREDGLNPPYYSRVCEQTKLLVRRTVASKLVRVNEKLKPYGVELFVLDGYRSVECQRALWSHFIRLGTRELGTKDPEKLRRFAGRYCSDPSSFRLDDQRTWPTHVTGGAVDVTLRRLNGGELLFMGTIFDDASETSATAAMEGQNALSGSALEARRNRRLLYHAMLSEGFANYANEWWHFDYGTQMWVVNSAINSSHSQTRPREAFYGPAIPSD